MAKQVADEAERKYEEISRKLAMVEHDLERAEDLGDNNSSKLKAAEVEISRLTEGKGLFWSRLIFVKVKCWILINTRLLF